MQICGVDDHKVSASVLKPILEDWFATSRKASSKQGAFIIDSTGATTAHVQALLQEYGQDSDLILLNLKPTGVDTAAINLLTDKSISASSRALTELVSLFCYHAEKTHGMFGHYLEEFISAIITVHNFAFNRPVTVQDLYPYISSVSLSEKHILSNEEIACTLTGEAPLASLLNIAQSNNPPRLVQFAIDKLRHEHDLTKFELTRLITHPLKTFCENVYVTEKFCGENSLNWEEISRKGQIVILNTVGCSSTLADQVARLLRHNMYHHLGLYGTKTQDFLHLIDSPRYLVPNDNTHFILRNPYTQINHIVVAETMLQQDTVRMRLQLGRIDQCFKTFVYGACNDRKTWTAMEASYALTNHKGCNLPAAGIVQYLKELPKPTYVVLREPKVRLGVGLAALWSTG